ncbi:MAG: hypothetical protein J4415_03695 [Candidatus Diapherotrites archaeon]|uniref:Uncharacterized protein n=1 Tax=Candidatus Iainarchaeum sp. TaxID=3101447 RepID=A0A8T4KVW3_9ARCH|nr:hypothetical protein [Candidatus Diapherotrites archaeon]
MLKKRIVQKPILSQEYGKNVFVMGEPLKEPGAQIDVLERMLNEKVFLGQPKNLPKGIQVKINVERRNKIDKILRTSGIPRASQVKIVNFIRLASKALKTPEERKTLSDAIKAFQEG